MARVGQGEVEQLERPEQRALGECRIPSGPLEGSRIEPAIILKGE
jgi:hypothetical protein